MLAILYQQSTKKRALDVFIHFSKAFDCAQHEPFVNKLEHYGVTKWV